MHYFSLELKDFILPKYFVTFYDNFIYDYGRILPVLKFGGKIITSLPRFLTIEIPYSKLFWGRTF